MHTIKVIGAGFVLLAVCLLIARLTAGTSQGAALMTAAKCFIPLWLIAAGINLWIGVSRAGYSLADEAPVFGVVFGVPAAAALLIWWLVSRG